MVCSLDTDSSPSASSSSTVSLTLSSFLTTTTSSSPSSSSLIGADDSSPKFYTQSHFTSLLLFPALPLPLCCRIEKLGLFVLARCVLLIWEFWEFGFVGEDVGNVVREVGPETIVVELCRSRVLYTELKKFGSSQHPISLE
ncbi:hypothetical protein Droror1_Dr00000225 [Drosera rotundifolia]